MPGKLAISLAAGLGAVAVLMLVPSRATSSSGGAPPSRTGAPLPGGFAELTCGAAQCHDDDAVNSGPGQLVIESPDGYTPGEALTFTVRLDEDDRSTFGFQVAVKDTTHNHVGTLEVVDAATTKKVPPTPPFDTYVTHTFEGTAQHAWTVRWVPPAEAAGAVTIYAAGNAANGDFSSDGDHIYTTSTTLAPETATSTDAAPPPGVVTLDRAYPNPAETFTTVGYTLDRAAPVTLSVYDVLGRRVRRLDLGLQPAGPHRARLETGDWTPGLYLYELHAADARAARPLLVRR